ncbi:KpsF/GutQ family sugar-phosphate isomerase [Citreimonas sp.]|uniref:KpsF/GutQ family sugar-phosphate isomerase n=1 Tax=Citreimonas sp. TaxID=3036715 RepID=UPI00405A2552
MSSEHASAPPLTDPATETPAQVARRVLMTESAALATLADGLPDDFERVVARLLEVSGRVIVSGMGKSGHVAGKIAATLASTGTPAQTVHPGEASHGDLGMITRADAVILISNSGETRELADMIAHCARFAIPLVAMTKRAGSTLAQAADHVLLLPDAPEACAIGMAPTTSTTMAMALGDALAVALMQHRGFDRESFAAFHPGGTLGAQLLRVSAVMHTGDALPVVTDAAPMSEVLLTMSSKGFGVAALVEGGRLTGIITDGDLRRNMDGLMDRSAGAVATRTPMTTRPGTLLTEALGMMNMNKRTVLLVVDDSDHLVGLLHIHDALRAGVA